ncbi:NHLM bacteriocin system ABC transporter peptidase/ATP-binding protein [Halanaerobium saccharolyticum]|uniref:NHLM bacteriocin system ABC transporter peptidase/ATP-binding protein n=1 Tax=Halanaerobium saccharolyticum TaxID=43595 RepID=A0A4R6M449_9FIRM|nr:NHLP family bacteriocin export ABC transporter peptidase/permease/ATPase subunit [Halanaerobium saccharolyticum]TDO95270.1 NHLM bacteriocin system ABC transporter peptidase/ATP-binding protein [Halanaerobium saccharolyticum]
MLKILNKVIKKLKFYKNRIKVPTVLQMEGVECGAASLAMILAYHGRFVPLEKLRIECGVSRDGSKASNILKAARNYNLNAYGKRVLPEKLRNRKEPAIIFWNYNHFLVFEAYHNGKFYLNDPGVGPRQVNSEEFNKAFTGIALFFEKAKEFEKGGNKKSTVKSLLKRLEASKLALFNIFFISLMLVIPGLLIPIFSRIFIDEILIKNNIDWRSALLFGMIGTAFFRGLLTWFQQHYLLKLESKVSISSSAKYLWHILRLPIEFFSQRSAGDISSRVSSNNKIAVLLSRELATTFFSLITIVFYFFLMLKYDPLLTLIGVTAAVINFILLYYFSKKREVTNTRLLIDRGKMMGVSMSGLEIIETLKATASESDFFAQLSGYHVRAVNSEQELEQTTRYLASVPEFLKLLTIVLILIIGTYRVLNGYLSIGMLVAFQSLMIAFMVPVGNLVNLGSTVQEIKGDLKRLDDVMDYPVDPNTEKEEDYSNFPKKSLSGRISIKNLTFGYNPLEEPLIKDFNLELEPGFRVALVGGSGSGKSTIAKLITGLYKPWDGKILFDGKEQIEIPELIFTDSLSFVDQEITVFSGTVAENLSLWDSTISESDLIKAAKDACIHSVITARENGYDSLLVEGGKNFSGGEKQRLEIARSLVNNPNILVMDEATSALDPKTELEVDKNIKRRRCTSIIVAHRLSTIRDCDEIIVLKNGEIVQRGTHEELIAEAGEYAELVNLT